MGFENPLERADCLVRFTGSQVREEQGCGWDRIGRPALLELLNDTLRLRPHALAAVRHRKHSEDRGPARALRGGSFELAGGLVELPVDDIHLPESPASHEV